MSVLPRSRVRQVLMIALAALILVPSLFGFGNKLLEFVALTQGDIEGIFALTPLVNYLLASFGFLCLFLWAVFNGMFHDIERPKHDLLETEAWLDGKRKRRPAIVQTRRNR